MILLKNKRGYFIFCFIFVFLLNFIYHEIPVKAAEDSSIKTFYIGDKQTTVSGTLFSDDGLLGPGDKLVKEFYIVNNNNFKTFLKGITINSTFYGKGKELLKENDVQYKNFIKSAYLTFYNEDKLLYSGNIQKFLEFNLTGEDAIEINPNSKRRFTIEYAIDEDADRSIMGMQHKFNIDFNFSADGIVNTDNDKTPTKDIETPRSILVQTGFLLDLKTLIIFGSFMCIIGITILIKKKKYN